MILLVGYPQDTVLRCYANYLHLHGIAAYVIDLHDVGRVISVDGEGFHAYGESLFHKQVSGVFNRLFLPSGRHVSQQCMQDKHMLYFLLDHYYEKVINRPTAGMHNFSKLWQQCAIESSVLKMVPSQVCIHKSVKVQGDMIMKSISSDRSICQKFAGGQLNEPVILQPDLGRHNIRVHCVQNQVFAQQVKCDALDYRYADQKEWVQITLPYHVTAACREMTKSSGLVVSGIDLIKQHGQYYVLEINPSPGYTYFESHMPRPKISAAITAFLLQ